MTVVSCIDQPPESAQNIDEILRPASLDEVTLLDSPFKAAQDRAADGLLTTYDPDRFLARPRIAAGLEPKAEPYEGWETRLTGHSLGHYLSGCSLAWVITKNLEFKQRVVYIVQEMEEIQEAYGNGFVAGPPETREQFENHISKGDITSAGFDLNGIWVPIYGMHKIFAGLRDAYQLTGNEKALEVEKEFGLWLYRQLMPLSDDDFVKIRACEHGGIQETLADLYADTGDERFLEFAGRFYDPMLMDPLSEGVDNLMGLHANTQLPKFMGLARIYELTGSPKERTITEFFWNRVANHHSYVTGGNSQYEHFGPPDMLNNRLTGSTTETCNVYNILKLSSYVFTWNHSPDVADFMERAMLNHSLSSQNPENAHVTYFLNLEQGALRQFKEPLGFTCCEGSGMEHHFLYPEFIYYFGTDRLFVNQFIASRLDWNEAGVVLTQNTGFPNAEKSELVIECSEPVTFELLIRKPGWAEKGVEITLNGEHIDVLASDDGYLPIKRQWQNGDVVTIGFPFTLRLESMPDNPDRIAVFNGPLALGGDLGPADDPAARDADYVPVLLTKGESPERWIRPAGENPNTFKTFGAGDPREISLRPFYQLYNRRYSLYWDVFTTAEWVQEKEPYRASVTVRRDLEERTVDFVQPGEMQPERDHNFRGENAVVGEGNRQKTRRVEDGWFSFDMKVLPSAPVAIAVSYPGYLTVNDKGSFDVEVDGTVVVTKTLDWHGQRSMEEVYAIPEDLTRGKEQVTVTFRAQPGSRTASVGGLRIIRM